MLSTFVTEFVSFIVLDKPAVNTSDSLYSVNPVFLILIYEEVFVGSYSKLPVVSETPFMVLLMYKTAPSTGILFASRTTKVFCFSTAVKPVKAAIRSSIL